MKYLILAWRNLWRNRKRTLITVSSVFFAVILCTLTTSMQEGTYSNMTETIIRFYSGSLQIHDTAYWKNKTINNSLILTGHLQKIVEQTDGVELVAPRIESFMLASAGSITRGTLVMGIDPDQENRITSISAKIISGRFLGNASTGIIIGTELARNMKLKVGDTLVLLGQGFQGVSAAGLFPVEGIMKHPSPEFDRQVIYMGLEASRELLSSENRITSLVLMCDELSELNRIKSDLDSRLDQSFSVMTWAEMQPLLVQYIESDRASGVIMQWILYLVIGFGILGTVIMMMMERRHEFGVMMAVGMHKGKIVRMITLETILIGIAGVITGIAASIPLIVYFYFHPIPYTGQAAEMMIKFGFEPVMPFSVNPDVFWKQAVVVLLITFLVAIYPWIAIFRLKITNALKS